VLDDLAHAVANMLKRREEPHPQWAPLLSACGRVSRRLTHTVLVCLAPPKVHTTSRFMPVHRVMRWAARVLGLLPAGRATAGAVGARLRTCLEESPARSCITRSPRAAPMTAQ
jgi:hypothetical protein